MKTIILTGIMVLGTFNAFAWESRYTYDGTYNSNSRSSDNSDQNAREEEVQQPQQRDNSTVFDRLPSTTVNPRPWAKYGSDD